MKSDTRIRGIDESICAFDRKDVVLDAGPGQDHYLRALSPKCNSVYAIDSNLRFLQNARSIIARENVILVNADLSKVPIRSGYFDKIICLEVLEHSEAPLGG
ncbi:class I SAM-dependent methyltransferase [bacterium]|nr:class I SAM-dependent methyltransferase [bacterium]